MKKRINEWVPSIAKKSIRYEHIVTMGLSSVPTRFLPLTVSVIVRVRGKLVRLELEETC